MHNWAENRKVTITGGAGFIGSNLAKRLVNDGAQVRIVDNLERGKLGFLADISDHIDFFEGDLRDGKVAAKALKDTNTVFHLAAKVSGIKVYLDRPGSLLNANAMIDQNVFKAAVELGIPHFFYASSSHLYPSSRQQSPDAAPLRESEALPAAPELTYGWGKLLGEITLLGLAKENPDFHVSIARIMGAYGYNQDYDLETGSVIPVFCHRAIRWPEGAPFGIWGSGNETRSYCFIDDIVDAIIKSVAVQDKLQVVGPFNLAAEGRIKISEIADTVIKISGKDIQPQYDITAKTVLWGQSADCSLTRNLLGGWTPKTIFEEGIKKTYRHIERRICG